MKISLILAHPNPQSFNHAIAGSAVKVLGENGHTIFYHDLYQERFNPCLPWSEIEQDIRGNEEIGRYCREISSSEGIIIVHPNWWGQPPAILKGWIDRVLRAGVAYRFEEGDAGEGVPLGLLKATTAVIFNTSNTPEAREKQVFGDPLENLWKNCIFKLCGVEKIVRRIYGVMVTSSDAERKSWLTEAAQLVRMHFPPDEGSL